MDAVVLSYLTVRNVTLSAPPGGDLCMKFRSGGSGISQKGAPAPNLMTSNLLKKEF